MSTSSAAQAETKTRTELRQNKLVISAPDSVPRLTGAEPQLETIQGSAELLEQLKPAFTTQHSLQAIGLSGRQLPLVTKDAQIAPYLFNAAGVRYVQPHPNGDASQRILLLNVPSASPTPDIVLSTIAKHNLEHIPAFPLSLGYDHLSSDQILEALLPSPIVSTDGVPTGFTIVGHIAHLNLLDVYLPFRFLVGHVMLSKHTGTLRTVVNKLDSIDAEFRFFQMELLAGEADFTARVSESDCMFEFDFRNVYWNSRLHAEHMRLIKQCRPGQVLADVMAGVGPFAVPAAKRGTWVLANDLNPSSYDSLVRNGRANKVLLEDGAARGVDGGMVATCMDGREFVRWSMAETWQRAFAGRPVGFDGDDADREDESLRESARKALKERAKHNRHLHAARQAGTDTPAPLPIAQPDRHTARRLVDHFVMNLPATALEFLDAFRGAYTHLASLVGRDALLAELAHRANSPDRTLHPLPMIHVHCFSKDPFTPALDILTRANAALGINPTAPHRLTARPLPPPHQTLAGLRKTASAPYLTSHPHFAQYAHLTDAHHFMHHVEAEWRERDGGKHTPGLSIHYVRDVAPNKQMYCLSFACPSEVLWAAQQEEA
ncbi:related to met-10 protein [Sporisorium reilianum SRZ2]|uniref:tRNA (guanine(37)-N1)-methyltransferase n=1 Tax=Sporisorium reilianum (strain SRZ2) TaxID=999809 RepID=E6ZK50_SPORE|nr:related to met-10 protein [Sporisorium reilianum SRZ2]